jgi:hypothetical protein
MWEKFLPYREFFSNVAAAGFVWPGEAGQPMPAKIFTRSRIFHEIPRGLIYLMRSFSTDGVALWTFMSAFDHGDDSASLTVISCSNRADAGFKASYSCSFRAERCL